MPSGEMIFGGGLAVIAVYWCAFTYIPPLNRLDRLWSAWWVLHVYGPWMASKEEGWRNYLAEIDGMTAAEAREWMDLRYAKLVREEKAERDQKLRELRDEHAAHQ